MDQRDGIATDHLDRMTDSTGLIQHAIYSVPRRESGYTTFLKLLQIMTEKGLVVRDESSRTHVYEAAYSQDQTQRQLVTDLLERAFDGSAAQLVLQALAAARSSPEELAEIRKLLRGAGASVKNDDHDDRKTGGSR